jgi:hypothetical protein
VFTGIVRFAGEISITLSVAAVMLTVTVAEPVMPPELPVIVAKPLLTAVAKPAACTVTAFVFDEDQVAVAVRSLLEPSE